MNGALWGRPCLIVLLVAGALTGCGSSSNSERTQLVNKLYSQLGGSNVPRQLGTCMIHQARGLPIGQLRAVANSGSNPSAAVKQLGLRLVSDCMQPGQPGLTAMHQLIVQSFDQAGGSSLPAAFRTCFEQKVSSTTANELTQLLSVYASQGTSAAQAQSIQLGRQLGAACLQQPSVLNEMRATYVSAVQRELHTSHDSSAYKACLLGKMRKLSGRQLSQLVLNPANAPQLAQRIGSDARKACIASGAKP